MKKKALFFVALFCFALFMSEKVMASDGNSNGITPCTEEVFDVLSLEVDYLYWKGGVFLMNKSPLSSFDNYKAIFNGYNIPQIEIDYPVGMMVTPLGQKYQPLWILMDDKLYLGDIYFYALSDESAKKEKFPRGEQYKELEQLTGVPFDKNGSFKKEDLPIGEKGVMPADWFDGVILVKERRGENENLEKWKTSPYYKLEFKKGRLQSVSKIEDGKVQTPKQQMHL